MANNQDWREFLGGQLCYAWLKYKIYDAFQIQKTQPQKRTLIKETLDQLRKDK